MIEVTINSSTLSYYRSKGYDVPSRPVQLWANIGGKRIRNGIKYRVARGTKIFVAEGDLFPASNVAVPFVCETCGRIFQTRWSAQRIKLSRNCVSCQAKKGFKGGCHSYWVERLIAKNLEAACDVCGERDRRFLELHHLLSRSLGGKNERENYVILSANYHRAFHNWMGGSGVGCRPEDYLRFREMELAP